jgi:hypothetical protein
MVASIPSALSVLSEQTLTPLVNPNASIVNRGQQHGGLMKITIAHVILARMESIEGKRTGI